MKFLARFLLVLSPGAFVLGCSPAGPLAISIGPKVDLLAPFRPPKTHPECEEPHGKCLAGCESRPDREKVEACRDVCESERKLCLEPPVK